VTDRSDQLSKKKKTQMALELNATAAATLAPEAPPPPSAPPAATAAAPVKMETEEVPPSFSFSKAEHALKTLEETETQEEKLVIKKEDVKVNESDDADLLAAVRHRDLHGEPKKRKLEHLDAGPTNSETSGDTIKEMLATPEKGAVSSLLMAKEIQYTHIQLSSQDMAQGMSLNEQKTSVTSRKGFRSVRTNLGFTTGTYICEVLVERLGQSGHARLGFGTKQNELQAPVGFDAFGYGYRDVDGSKVHKAKREKYAEAFKEKDVVGMLLHLPLQLQAEAEDKGEKESNPLGTKEGSVEQLTGSKDGAAAALAAAAIPAQATVSQPSTRGNIKNSKIIFFKNGVYQGIAFEDLLEGSYFPCGSLYTLPDEKEGACLVFNFGETPLSQNYSDVLMKLDDSVMDPTLKAELVKNLKPMYSLKAPKI